MVRANDKLSVLSAEAPINAPLVTDGTAFHQLQEEMRSSFESTVIDLPRGMLIQYPHLVHDAHVTVVVVELTLAATRDAIRILSWLKANAPTSRVLVVANRVPASGPLEITRKDFENSIERSIDFVIPADPKLLAQAAKLGKPLAEVASAGKVSQPLVQLAAAILAQTGDGEAGSAEGATNSLLSNLKAMMKPKPKPEK